MEKKTKNTAVFVVSVCGCLNTEKGKSTLAKKMEHQTKTSLLWGSIKILSTSLNEWNRAVEYITGQV